MGRGLPDSPQAESLTILLTTHYLEEADQLADRLAIVSQGKVVVEGTPAELKARPEGDAVHVELSDGRIDDARRVLARVGARPRKVLDGRTLVLAGRRRRRRAARDHLRARRAPGSPSQRSSVSRPSLDDVYLHFTGRDSSRRTGRA